MNLETPIIPKGAQYRAFHIADQDKVSGFRIGGSSPQNVHPAFQNKFTRYLLTAPVSDALEVSLFHRFDFENDGESNPFDVAYTFHDDSNTLIQAVFHGPAKRADAGGIISDIPGRELVLSGVISIENSVHDPYSLHKMGGFPAFARGFDSGISARLQGIIDDESYVHAIQLAFPSGPDDDVLDCDWPFGDAIFHLLMRRHGDHFRYKYCWG
jgi:hypothetical protein